MNFRAAALCFSIIILVPNGTFADFSEWRKLTNNAFKPGELVVYQIKFGGISAGQASLHVIGIEDINGRPAYHIISKAKTNKALDKIFKVRDSNDSWMDVEGLVSVQFMQNVREGGYRKWSLTRFDQPNAEFHYEKKGKGRDDRIHREMPDYTQDVLSSIYYVRTLDLKEHAEHTLHANSGGTNWPLKVLVHGIENVDVPVGTFACYRVEPILSGEGIFQHRGSMEVWMTNDRRKIPVKLKSKVAVGSFEAEMIEYSVFGKPAIEITEE